MGRCNNRRVQQQAAQMRNTPSRARFSKGPPSKRNNNNKRNDNDKIKQNADTIKAGVVQKIAQRAQQQKTKASTTTFSRKKRHPLDGLDVSTLDEIRLSESSIQLITKLLQDLNIIIMGDTANATASDDDDNDVSSSSAVEEADVEEGEPPPPPRGDYYSEYNDDVEEETIDDVHVPAIVGEEDEDISNSDEEEVKDTSSSEDRIRKSLLFQHLTAKLSFSDHNALRACVGVESWNSSANTKTDSSEDPGKADTLDSEHLSLAFDWLCLHLTDQELTHGFKPNPKAAVLKSASGILLVGSGKTRAIPHESISIAKPITSDVEWRESVRRETLRTSALRLGFSSSEAQRACEFTVNTNLTNVNDDEAILKLMLVMLEEQAMKDETSTPEESSPTMNDANETDLALAKEELEQEISALEAIYDENFVTHDGVDHFAIRFDPVEELQSPANSSQCHLHVFCRKGYPIWSAPLLLFTNPTLPPSLLRRVNLHLACEVNRSIGEPSVFLMVDYLSNSLHEIQIDFIKEQRTKEMEAEQLRMRRAVGHNVDDDNQTSVTNGDGKISKRQRAKLRAMEKAYDRDDQLLEQEKERLRKEEERIANIQNDSKYVRHNNAERVIEERERSRVEAEAETAARSAMNIALNRGDSVEEARRVADVARTSSLRNNGIEHETPNDDHNAMDAEESIETKGSSQQPTAPQTAAFMDRSKETNPSQQVTVNSDTTMGGTPFPTNTPPNNATATTSAFMERLRKYYDKAVERKLDPNNEQEGEGSDEHEGDTERNLVFLTSPTAHDEVADEERHLPRPVAIPTGDLGKVMEDVISVQKQQPWLVSPEARVPTSVPSTSELSPKQQQLQEKTSRILRESLERKYKDADLSSKQQESKKAVKGSLQERFSRMLSQRERLPAYKMKEEIVRAIASNQVCVVSADTGAGKTTQVPQLVLDDMIWKGRGAEANMIVTQPRRISAIGVSERVAAERCEKVGETAGYSIRMESKKSSKTRILLCTTGILLRRLQCDPDLASVSHVFVDEVHERDLNTDFLLIILRDLLSRRKGLKLILMSATLNAASFSDYFGGCPVVSIPGRTFPVTEHRLEDVLHFTGYEVQEGSDYAQKISETKPPKYSKSKLRQRYFPKYPTPVISSLSIVNESVINYELIAALLEHIALNEEEGAILVFMPGMAEITKTIEEIYKKDFFQSSKVVVYPLHSSLSSAEQTAVFDIPPEGVRKVVVATNIAETSITIEDVVYVVDSAKVKENRKDELNELPTLVECWVSRASAKQRRGRAGRVRPGIAYHMYSSHTHDDEMQEYQLPEMLRVGLEDLVLQILLLDLGEPTSFLAKAVNPPSALAMKNSLRLLEGLGAVDIEWDESDRVNRTNKADDGANCGEVSVDLGLTALGFHLATLPVDPRVGKMMIYGALFGCTQPALTIAASMSARSPFLSPFDKRDQADEARRTFAVDGSDHLTTLEAFNQWKEMSQKNGGKATSAFLRDSFLSRLTLYQMEDLRKQFAKLLVEIGFLPRNFKVTGKGSEVRSSANANATNSALVKAVLCAGLYPNIIVAPRNLVGDRPGNQEAGECAFRSYNKGEVYLHPCTISFTSKQLPGRYCCYHDIVKTRKVYVRDITTVSEFAVLLFGGSLKIYHSRGVVTVDDWIRFRLAAKPAALVKHLRAQMESMLLRKIVSPREDITGSKEGQALIQAVSTLLDNEKKSPLPDGAEIVRPWTGQVETHRPGRSGRGDGGRGGRGRGHDGGRGGRGRGRDGTRGRGGRSARGRNGRSRNF